MLSICNQPNIAKAYKINLVDNIKLAVVCLSKLELESKSFSSKSSFWFLNVQSIECQIFILTQETIIIRLKTSMPTEDFGSYSRVPNLDSFVD